MAWVNEERIDKLVKKVDKLEEELRKVSACTWYKAPYVPRPRSFHPSEPGQSMRDVLHAVVSHLNLDVSVEPAVGSRVVVTKRKKAKK